MVLAVAAEPHSTASYMLVSDKTPAGVKTIQDGFAVGCAGVAVSAVFSNGEIWYVEEPDRSSQPGSARATGPTARLFGC